MSSYPTREIGSALTKKGFREDDTHHHLFWLYVSGEKTPIRTRLSHSAREYGDSLLAMVAREMNLRRSELNAFVECPLGYQDYIRLLGERGFL